MNIIKDSLKTIALSLLVLSLISVAYAWTEPSQTPPNGNVSAPLTVSSDQYKSGALGIGGILRGYSNAIFDGNVGIGTGSPGQKLSVAGTIESTSGGIKFPDGTTQTTAATGGGITSESDPTVPASLKDGVSWGEISGIPAGFADGIDNDTILTKSPAVYSCPTTPNISFCKYNCSSIPVCNGQLTTSNQCAYDGRCSKGEYYCTQQTCSFAGYLVQ